MGMKSTFEINHDVCRPEKWTASDVLAFADFVRTGNLLYAATLSRLGIRLIQSDRLIPSGGTLQECGWAKAGSRGVNEVYEDLSEMTDDDITAACRIYRGPTVYAARYATGDDEGNFEGYEFEIVPTEADAKEYLASIYDNPLPDDGHVV